MTSIPQHEGGSEPSGARAPTAPSLLDNSVTQADELPFTVSDKVIVSGDIIEHFHFGKPLHARMDNPLKRKKKKPSIKVEQSPADLAKSRERSSRDSANKIRRLIDTNFNIDCRFFTLTFGNDNEFSLSDFTDCNYAFKKFIQRLKHSYNLVAYLAVPEFQKRGAIHYHVIMDIPYIDQKELEKVWGMGFVWIKKIKDTPNVGSYLTKYLRKNSTDPRLYGKKCYFCSKGLKRPIVLYGKDARNQLAKASIETIYISDYPSEFNGKIDYKKYKKITSQEVIT